MKQETIFAIRVMKTAILRKLHSVNVTSVEVEWSGGGDDGQIQSIVPRRGEANSRVDLSKHRMKLRCPTRESINKGTPEQPNYVTVFGAKTRGLSVEDAIEELWYALIERHDQTGWENGEGGYGSMTLDVRTRKVEFSHSYNEVVSEVAAQETL